MYATDRRQTKASLNASALLGGGIIMHQLVVDAAFASDTILIYLCTIVFFTNKFELSLLHCCRRYLRVFGFILQL